MGKGVAVCEAERGLSVTFFFNGSFLDCCFGMRTWDLEFHKFSTIRTNTMLWILFMHSLYSSSSSYLT